MGTHTWKSSHSWRCHVGSDAAEPEIKRKAEGQRITNHEYIQDIYTQGSDEMTYDMVSMKTELPTIYDFFEELNKFM